MRNPCVDLPEEERLQQIAELLAIGAMRYLRRQGPVTPATRTPDAAVEVWDLVEDEVEKQILAYLGHHVVAEPAAMRAALGLAHATLARRLSRLRLAGLVQASGKTTAVRYELASTTRRN